MPKILITLSGCDDETNFIIEMTEDQCKFMEHISSVSKLASDCQCKPTMKVQPVVIPENNGKCSEDGCKNGIPPDAKISLRYNELKYFCDDCKYTSDNIIIS